MKWWEVSGIQERESKIGFPQGLSNGRKDETLTGAGTEYGYPFAQQMEEANCWQASTRLYGVTSQRTELLIATNMGISGHL
jgi:hypothetical protein